MYLLSSIIIATSHTGLMNMFSILGSLTAPYFEGLLGTKLLIGIAGVLHAGMYIGVAVLREWVIFLGSILSGL